VEALHVYCIIGDGAELGPGLIGLGGRQVFTVPHRDLAAVVSPSPLLAYRSQRAEILPHLFAHQAVLEKVLEARTVVPVKFGTTARDGEEVRTILEKGYPQLRATVAAMEGKLELDVVVLWRDLRALLREIGAEAEIGRATAGIADRPPEETREERVQIGKMVMARLDERRGEAAMPIVEALQGLVEDMCPHALADDRMILNTALLVERSRQAEVGQALHRLDDRDAGRLDFRCVGPLPPYSFSTVEIRRFAAEGLERARRLLGLNDQGGPTDVKAAYRRMAHGCHPDKGPAPQGNGDRFAEVTEAYRLLTDHAEAAGQAPLDPHAAEMIAVKVVRWGAEACRV
jgi:hypothetical protein